MTLTVGITLVAVSMAAITAIIAVVQQLHIQSKESDIEDLEREISDLRTRHREVVDKLEGDLKQADIEYDALNEELNGSIRAREIELHHKQVMQSVHDAQIKFMKDQLNQANAQTFTGRKRNNRGQYVAVNKDVEP